MRLADLPHHSYGNPPWLRFWYHRRLHYYWERKPAHIVSEILNRVTRGRVVRHDCIRHVIMLACEKYSGSPMRTYVAVMGRPYDDQLGMHFNWFKDGSNLRIGDACDWEYLKRRADSDDAVYSDISTRREVVPIYPVTDLVVCEGCGKIARKESQSGIAHRWMRGDLGGMFCVGCWNRRRPIEKKLKEADEIKKLVNKLNKTRLETTKWQKSQQQAI